MSRPKKSRAEVVDQLISSGLWSDSSLSRLVVVGMRGYFQDSMGEWGENDRGIYDDAIFVMTPEGFVSFNANVDPSRERDGMASLVAPQKVRYRPGYHGYNSSHGHYAFRQDSDILVDRDGGVGSGTRVDGHFKDSEENRFWINLHRGGVNSTSSAGCQTLPVSQWDEFHELVLNEIDKFNQTTFNYYLIEA